MPEGPPIYLALDLWMALGLDDGKFDDYYERNGWADTWSNLLAEVRWHYVPMCGAQTPDGRCVLHAHKIGPHMSAIDVGSSEPLPFG